VPTTRRRRRRRPLQRASHRSSTIEITALDPFQKRIRPTSPSEPYSAQSASQRRTQNCAPPDHDAMTTDGAGAHVCAGTGCTARYLPRPTAHFAATTTTGSDPQRHDQGIGAAIEPFTPPLPLVPGGSGGPGG
jgi:hypothetical protein